MMPVEPESVWSSKLPLIRAILTRQINATIFSLVSGHLFPFQMMLRSAIFWFKWRKSFWNISIKQLSELKFGFLLKFSDWTSCTELRKKWIHMFFCWKHKIYTLRIFDNKRLNLTKIIIKTDSDWLDIIDRFKRNHDVLSIGCNERLTIGTSCTFFS